MRPELRVTVPENKTSPLKVAVACYVCGEELSGLLISPDTPSGTYVNVIPQYIIGDRCECGDVPEWEEVVGG